MDSEPICGRTQGAPIFKAKKLRGVRISYKRITDLVEKIARMPGVDLLAIVRDTLYDLPPDRLAKVVKKITEELEKPEPDIVTEADTTYRGTSIRLRIGDEKIGLSFRGET